MTTDKVGNFVVPQLIAGEKTTTNLIGSAILAPLDAYARRTGRLFPRSWTTDAA